MVGTLQPERFLMDAKWRLHQGQWSRTHITKTQLYSLEREINVLWGFSFVLLFVLFIWSQSTVLLSTSLQPIALPVTYTDSTPYSSTQITSKPQPEPLSKRRQSQLKVTCLSESNQILHLTVSAANINRLCGFFFFFFHLSTFYILYQIIIKEQYAENSYSLPTRKIVLLWFDVTNWQKNSFLTLKSFCF